MTAPNRNLLWTQIFVEELARCGVQHVVIAPGSRSTPLVMAFADHGGFTVHSIIDERSAAFFALGIGLATGKPAALVCSSGTATANFYPAVIEAHYSHVPLLVLTADRPHELRDSGANQTVDQVRLYGQHVLWSVDVALPESAPSGVMLRSLRTLACRAVATATGIVAGPVHLNFPFRKPLEPIAVPSDDTHGLPARSSGAPFTQISRPQLVPTKEQIGILAELLSTAHAPLMIAGPRAASALDDKLAAVLKRFTQSYAVPLLADPLSNLRYADSGAIGSYDLFLTADGFSQTPDLVILLGGMPSSKALEDFFVKTDLPNVVLITPDGQWTDPYHRLTHLIQADPMQLFEALLAESAQPSSGRTAWYESFLETNHQAAAALSNQVTDFWFDGAAVAATLDALPNNSNIFIGNSLPIRHLEQFGLPTGNTHRVFCNRGASGIDGTVSTAYGIAAATGKPTVFITGDLAFYHDMNGFMAAQRTGAQVITVLINNDGGGIFRRLPIEGFEPTFTDLFLTPHGLDFWHTAQLYGLVYQSPVGRADFARCLADALDKGQNAVIEVKTDGVDDAHQRQALLAAVKHQITNLLNNRISA